MVYGNNILGDIYDFAEAMKENQSGLPNVADMFQEMDTFHIVLLAGSLMADLICLMMTGFKLVYLMRYTSNDHLRSLISFILVLPAVIALASAVGLVVPRSALFLYTVMNCYSSFCIFIVVKVMFAMYGSRRALQRYMLQNNQRIHINISPYLTWAKCLPTFPVTTKNLRILELLVVQTVIVRIVITVVDMICFLEVHSRSHFYFTISSSIGIASMLLAFFATYVLTEAGRARLKPYNFMTMFRLFDWLLTLLTVQKVGVDVMVALGWIQETEWMTASGLAMFYLNVAYSWEILILAAYIGYAFNVKKTILYDLHPSVRARIETLTNSPEGPLQARPFTSLMAVELDESCEETFTKTPETDQTRTSTDATTEDPDMAPLEEEEPYL